MGSAENAHEQLPTAIEKLCRLASLDGRIKGYKEVSEALAALPTMTIEAIATLLIVLANRDLSIMKELSEEVDPAPPTANAGGEG